MKTILMTGANGFLGSSLTLGFLKQGATVWCWVRNDPEGQRMRAALERAAEGFGLELTTEDLRRLKVTSGELLNLLNTKHPEGLLLEVDEVWHCAAHMSYAVEDAAFSMTANLHATLAFFHWANERLPDCRRFYFTSSIYTAGIVGGRAEEVLHAIPHLPTPYHSSKWSAEQILGTQSQYSRIPVSIVRPSSILGHSRSFWSNDNNYGYNIFVKALSTASKLGIREIHTDLNPQALVHAVCIDEVVQAALALSSRINPETRLEVFHCTHSQPLTSADHLKLIGEVTSTKVYFGKPVSSFDRRLDRMVGNHKSLISARWEFGWSNLHRETELEFRGLDEAGVLKQTVEIIRTVERAAASARKPA